jgi:hypothetical protein
MAMCSRAALQRIQLAAAAELDDTSSITLAGPAFGQRHVLLHRFALFGGFLTGLFAGLGFSIKGLGDARRPAYFAQRLYLHFVFATFITDLEHIANVDFARRFGFKVAGANAAEIAGFAGQCACLEEARRPEPFVNSHGGH